MTIKKPDIPKGHGLSVEAMVYYGEDLIQQKDQHDHTDKNDEAAPLDLESLRLEISKYRKKHPSLDKTIDLSFIA